jgi:hypothetical protein
MSPARCSGTAAFIGGAAHAIQLTVFSDIIDALDLGQPGRNSYGAREPYEEVCKRQQACKEACR